MSDTDPRRLLFASPHTSAELVIYIVLIVPSVLVAHALAGVWAGAAAAFAASLLAAAWVSHRRRRR